MVANLHVAKHKEYPIFTLICPFYLSSTFVSFTIAKLEIVVVEEGGFIEF
jgi:hypothetical protein